MSALCLSRAIQKGDLAQVVELLSRGVGKYGTALLHAAARRCRVDVVELLLRHGADPNVRDVYGVSGVVWCLPVAETLVRAGARIDVVDVKVAASRCDFHVLDLFSGSLPEEAVAFLLDRCGERGVEYLRRRGLLHPIFDLVAVGDVSALEELLRSGVDPNLRDPMGRTALHQAALHCRADVVELLLRHGADPNVVDKSGETPLHYAARARCIEVAEVLLRHGADPNLGRGLPPLWEACSQPDFVELLLRHGADPNARMWDSDAPLHLMAQGGCIDAIAVMLDHGADPDVENNSRTTPAAYAADSGYADVVYLLWERGARVTLREAALLNDTYLAEELLRQGANPNERDARGLTPLHYAFRDWGEEPDNWHLHMEVAEVLLRHGADPNVRDFEGKTPLHYAVWHSSFSAVKLLIDHGAEVDPEMLWPVLTAEEEFDKSWLILRRMGIVKLFAKRGALAMRDDEGKMLLHKLPLAEGVVHYYKYSWLLQFGADPNARDRLGRTPLHYAAMRGGDVLLLLEFGADPNVRDFEGKTPLHYAIASRRLEEVKYLLDYGAEVDTSAAGELCLTPLHLTALRGDLEETKRLLAAGAGINARDVFGRTPLHYAAARNHRAVAELLLSHGADPLAEDEEGVTPLSLAAKRCAADVVELFLPRVGEEGVRRVVSAAGCLAVLKRLGFEVPERVRRRCEPYVAWALKGSASSVSSILFHAAYEGCGEVASVLRRRFPAEVVRRAAFELVGLTPPEKLRPWQLGGRCLLREDLIRGIDPNARNANGETPLHVAVRCNDRWGVEYLLKLGADPNARNANGETPLHVAAKQGGRHVVASVLLRHGADPNVRDFEGKTPLHTAAREGLYAMALVLIRHGADVNARDSLGNTPLHYAAEHCHYALAQLLLKYGADVGARNAEGKTPADLVSCGGTRRVLEKLLKQTST